MNERIKQLANQCMVEVKNVPCKGIDGWTTLETVRQIDPEKFAELIVRECANIDFTEKSKGNFNALQTNWISNIIIEHFEDEE